MLSPWVCILKLNASLSILKVFWAWLQEKEMLWLLARVSVRLSYLCYAWRMGTGTTCPLHRVKSQFCKGAYLWHRKASHVGINQRKNTIIKGGSSGKHFAYNTFCPNAKINKFGLDIWLIHCCFYRSLNNSTTRVLLSLFIVLVISK